VRSDWYSNRDRTFSTVRLRLSFEFSTLCKKCWCWYVCIASFAFVLFLRHVMVTICTASLTFSNSTFCPHSVFMCFVWIWEQTAIISLYNTNWLVFITETECVYCAVRTECLNINKFILVSKQLMLLLCWHSCPVTFYNLPLLFLINSSLQHVALKIILVYFNFLLMNINNFCRSQYQWIASWFICIWSAHRFVKVLGVRYSVCRHANWTGEGKKGAGSN
jgi:hypothetical protein